MTAVLILLLSVDKMTASVHQRRDGRWTLDGEAPGATIEGRAEWRESAVGGKALVFNGVEQIVVSEGVRAGGRSSDDALPAGAR